MSIAGAPISGAPISAWNTTAGTFIPTVLFQLANVPGVQRVYLFEFGTIKLSTHGYATSGETVDQIYPACISNAFNFRSKMYASNKLVGGSGAGAGDITLLNGDGELDGDLDTDWDSGELCVKVGQLDDAYPDFVTMFKGMADGITWDEDKVNVRIRDRTYLFEGTIQPTLYAGTGGTEGGADLKGKPKPLCFGEVYNVLPANVDASGLVYQVHDGAINSILAVYDAGLLVSSSLYTTDLPNGRFTLNTAPGGTVTADVRGANTGGYVNTAQTIVRHVVANYGGLTDPDDLDTDSFFNVGLLSTQVMGIYTGTTPVSIKNVLDRLMASVGGYWRFTRANLFQVGILVEPADLNADIVLAEQDLFKIKRIATAHPVWKTSVGYKKAWEVMNPDRLAGAVTIAQRQFLGEEYRFESVEDATLHTNRPLAAELIQETLMISQTDAAAEATRQQALFGVEGRSLYDLTVAGVVFSDAIGFGVHLTFDRFGLDAGKLFVVVGSEENTRTDQQKLTIWG